MWGWLPAFGVLSLVSRGLDAKQNEKLGVVLGVPVILWMLWAFFRGARAVATEYVWPAVGARVAGSSLVSTVVGLAQSVYGFLDGFLAPATGFVLLFAPLAAAILLPGRTTLGSRFLRMLMGIAAFVSGLVLFWLAASGLAANPATALVYGGAILGMVGFDVSKMNSMKTRYSSENLLRGLKIRRIGEAQVKDRGATIRTGLFIAIIAAFWFRLTLTETVLVAFYSTAIGGLLAIIGFAALVFTFTYEAIPTMRLRREVAADTRSVQQASTIVVVTSVFGLVLTDGPLVLGEHASGVMGPLHAGIFVCAFSGLLVATDTVMTLFRHVATVLADLGNANAVANICFEESRTADGDSATSDSATGLSELRNCLEERGCNVIPLADAPWASLAGTRNLILVIPRVTQALGDSLFDGYGRVIEDGNILLVLTDRQDWMHKSALVRRFGFLEPEPVDGDQWLPVRQCIDAENSARAIGLMPSPLVFRDTEGQFSLLEMVPVQGEAGKDRRSVAVARRHGKGWIVVVSSLLAFQNAQLQQSRDLRLVHCLLDRLIELFPEQARTGPFRRRTLH